MGDLLDGGSSGTMDCGTENLLKDFEFGCQIVIGFDRNTTDGYGLECVIVILVTNTIRRRVTTPRN